MVGRLRHRPQAACQDRSSRSVRSVAFVALTSTGGEWAGVSGRAGCTRRRYRQAAPATRPQAAPRGRAHLRAGRSRRTCRGWVSDRPAAQAEDVHDRAATPDRGLGGCPQVARHAEGADLSGHRALPGRRRAAGHREPAEADGQAHCDRAAGGVREGGRRRSRPGQDARSAGMPGAHAGDLHRRDRQPGAHGRDRRPQEPDRRR